MHSELSSLPGGPQGGVGDDDIDVAVFRFTLGIPGFDDRLIPRYVGAVLGLLIVVNNLLGAQPPPEAQVRAEFINVTLAALCVVVPEIEVRLREALPGRGRMASAGAIAGSTNAFMLAAGLAETLRQELAWSSFALLKNTNSIGMLVQRGPHTLLARGALGSSTVLPGGTDPSLVGISKDLTQLLGSSPELQSVVSGKTPQLWLQDKGSMAQALKATSTVLPAGAESLLLQHVPARSGRAEDSAVLILFCERPRALSDRERIWAGSMANKLTLVM
ncbi:MAG: hypothetical protein WDW38_000837 [Sanguina aurantia]